MANIPRPRVEAIDVAHYQVITDEAAIPHLPVMTCKGSEGATYRDPTRPNWIRIFRTRAEIMGMYHWVRSDSSMEGQVQNLAACYREEGALPRDGELAPGWIVQLDWERTYKKVNGVNVLVRDLTVAEIELWHFHANIVFGPGRVVTYGSDWVPNFTTWRQRHPDLPVWYANYSLSDLPSGGQQESAKYKACLWQWSSQVMVPGLDTASRPGIDVSEILNHAQLRAAAHLATPAPPVPQPQPEPQPTPQGDDDVLRLLRPTDSPVRLFAMCTPQGAALRCEWTGPGDAQGSNPRIEFYRKAHPAGAVPFEMDLSVADLINVSLDGVLPDGLKAEHFANRAEIEARMTTGTVDTVARAATAQLNDAVGRLGQSVGDIQTGLIKAGGG